MCIFNQQPLYSLIIGIVSTGSVKKQPLELVQLTAVGESPTPLSPYLPQIGTHTVATGSPQFDDAHYSSTAGLQNSIELNTKSATLGYPISPPSDIGTKKLTPNSPSILQPPSILTSGDSQKLVDKSFQYSNLSSPMESPTAKSHYYSSPTTDVSNLSFPMVGGIYDTINEDQSEVPRAENPELAPGYDQIHIPDEKVHIIIIIDNCDN